MKKNLEKIFASASIVVAIILIMVLLITAFGGIETSEFQTKLVQGLLVTLAILYVVLSIATLVIMFATSDATKEITLRSEQKGAVKVTARVISKMVKNGCSGVEGVKCQKITLVVDEYGVRLKVNVKVVDRDVIEAETYLRTLLEDMFASEFGFKFHTIEFKIVALTSKYQPNKEELDKKVAQKLAEMKQEDNEQSDELVEEVAQEEVSVDEQGIEQIVEDGSQELEEEIEQELVVDETVTNSDVVEE